MDEIIISHGNGGELSEKLIKGVILNTLESDTDNLTDSADIGNSMGFTTDSFVIFPQFFPGGDIGKLSVCGTINDLVMSGYEPQFISLALILEEGFEISQIQRIIKSIKEVSDKCGVKVVTGDTKVVEKGSGSGIYINTSGIGMKITDKKFTKSRVEVGDKLIVTGNVGDHGIAILCERHDILKGQLESDCHPLVELVPLIRKYGEYIKVMRDPTRGGVATTLNELVECTDKSILIEEDNVPYDEKVLGACEIFGLDPLYSANEGKCVMIVSGDKAQEIIEELRKIEFFRDASIIGEVVNRDRSSVLCKTRFGGKRILNKLTHDIMPRIC